MSLIRTIRRMFTGHSPRLQPDVATIRLPRRTVPDTATLGPGEWKCISKPSGMVIECLRGRIRVSQDDGPDNLALDGGQHHRVQGNAPLYIEAAPEGKVRLSRGVASRRVA